MKQSVANSDSLRLVACLPGSIAVSLDFIREICFFHLLLTTQGLNEPPWRRSHLLSFCKQLDLHRANEGSPLVRSQEPAQFEEKMEALPLRWGVKMC